MKKIILLTSLVLLSGLYSAQSNSFLKMKEIIQTKKPELQLNDKLIALCIWKVTDNESRNCGKAFERAYVTYYKAKLKGGTKGLVVVCVSEDDLSELSIIGLSKDGIVESLPLKKSDLNEAHLEDFKNIVFDDQGNTVYKNLVSDRVFSSIQSLITR